MGQKQSSNHQKKSRPSTSKIECTEIVDIEFTDATEAKMEHSSPTIANSLTMIRPANYPQELLKVVRKIDEIQEQIDSMTNSQIHLYFPTLKDDLHNNWEKVYGIRNTTDEVRDKKVEIIEKIKLLLKNLNERFLKRNSRNFLD